MSATVDLDTAAARLGTSRRSVDRWVRANANADRTRSHINVGGVAVPVLRIGGRWAAVARVLDAALTGEAVSA